jgi:hypothetical protein
MTNLKELRDNVRMGQALRRITPDEIRAYMDLASISSCDEKVSKNKDRF